MFTLANPNLVAPITTPVLFAPANNQSATDYLSDLKATDPTTQATLGAIIKALADTANSNDDSALRVNCRKVFSGDSYVQVANLLSAPAANADLSKEEDALKDNIQSNLPATIQWIIDLVNAAKKKPLETGNVESYFAMLSHTSTRPAAIASFINSVHVFFPDMILDEAFRSSLSVNTWSTYRQTRVSTGKILSECKPVFIALGILAEGDEVCTAIDRAALSPWDISYADAIPGRFKAYASLYLESSGIGIDSWYQGNKAVNNLPAARVKGIKQIFKQYLRIVNNVDDIDEAGTIEDLSKFKTIF